MKTNRLWLLALGVLAALVLLGGGAYAAAKGNNGSNASAGAPTPAKVAGTAAGMPATAQVWYAVVNADGTLARAFPSGTSSSKIAGFDGSYEILFRQDLTGCSYTATIGNAGAGNPAHGSIVVAARAGNAKGVFVETRDTQSGPTVDHPFHLQVAC
jgi:hypothetical protein